MSTYKLYLLPLIQVVLVVVFLVFFPSGNKINNKILAVFALLGIVYLTIPLVKMLVGDGSITPVTPSSIKIRDVDMKRIAYHEAGHAVMFFALQIDSANLESVGINVESGEYDDTLDGQGGQNKFTQIVGPGMMTEEDWMKILSLYCAGRVAEELMLGDYTGGSSDDMSKATKSARIMVKDYGFGRGDTSHFVSYSDDTLLTDETRRRVEEAVTAIIERAYVKAKVVLSSHKGGVQRVATALLDKKALSSEEVINLIKEVDVKP